jgi:hypothetical protein
MSEVAPARIGLLVDYLDEHGGFDENILASLPPFVRGGLPQERAGSCHDRPEV